MDYLTLRDFCSGDSLTVRRVIETGTLSPVESNQNRAAAIVTAALDLAGLLTVKREAASIVNADNGNAVIVTTYKTAALPSPRAAALRLYDLFESLSPALQDYIVNAVYSFNPAAGRDSTLYRLNRIERLTIPEGASGQSLSLCLAGIGFPPSAAGGAFEVAAVDDLGELYERLSAAIYRADCSESGDSIYLTLRDSIREVERIAAINPINEDDEL